MDDQLIAGSEKNVVQSLAKGFRVLEAFTAIRREMTLAEVARAADIDNATAFRFLNTLVQLGYVEKIPDTKRFRLALKCLDLGFSAIARTDIRDLARPLLRTLVDEHIEAASVAVSDGADIVYVERVQAGFVRLGVDVRIGSRAPAYSTAVGQVILAHLTRSQQLAILDAAPRRKVTATTLTSIDALMKRLALVRAQGFALSDQENVTGLRVLAAPVLDADGLPVAGLSVAAPAFLMPLKAFEKLARSPVIAAARTLSRALQAAGGIATPEPKHALR
jgi:IclR family transcriptional regulator, pca regulon regulatory protein